MSRAAEDVRTEDASVARDEPGLVESSAASPESAGESEAPGAVNASAGPVVAPSQPAPPDTAQPLPPSDSAAVSEPIRGDCFEYLGEWIRCENAGWPNVVDVGAQDVEGCMQACLEREDCTAVTDYYWLGMPGLGCLLYTSSCDAPSTGVWHEEDAGRDYRKVCPG